MFLKQVRTYILIAVVLSVYGYFVYLPFRRESLNDVIIDYTNTAKTLQVNSPLYGSTLNDLLNENLKLRGLFYNRFRDVTDPYDQAWYQRAESMTHQIQLDLLILLLNHDLYKATNGDGTGQLTKADCKKLSGLIDSMSDRNSGKADELQKTAYKLMRDKGADVGAIYVLAHDMLLLMQMDDPINQTLYNLDLQLLKVKEKQLQPQPSAFSGFMFGQIRSSFINQAVDDAISTLQMGKTMQVKPVGNANVAYAQNSFDIPSLPSQSSGAYVKMTGVDNGVQYRNYVNNVFTWDVPDGNYDIEIDRNGDFPWQVTQQISQTSGITANLSRSDDTLLSVFKPSMKEAFMNIVNAMLSFVKIANEPQAITSSVNLEMAIDSWHTQESVDIKEQYRSDILPENQIDQLQHLNDQFYSVVHGGYDSEQTKQQLIMNTLSRSNWDKANAAWHSGQAGSPVKLDYNYVDVEAFTTSPLPTMYVTFAWITPDMKNEAWNVVFQMQNGRYVIIGVDTPSNPQQVQKVARLFSYKTKNQTQLLKKFQNPSSENFEMLFHAVLPQKSEAQTDKSTKPVTDTSNLQSP
jgi:hypothetical protein